MISNPRMVGTEQITEPGTQGRPGFRPARHQWVQRSGVAGLYRTRGQPPQEPGATAQAQNLVSDGSPNGGPLRRLKNAQGQVLDRKCAAWAIRRELPSFAAEDHV